MRILDVVIYTDKLDEVRNFYQRHFAFDFDTKLPTAFSMYVFGEARITYIDAASAGASPSQGIVLRFGMPYPNLERDRLLTAGVTCSELRVENWGPFYGEQVRYYAMTDPSQTQILFFEDRYGHDKQLMKTGSGVETRELQK